MRSIPKTIRVFLSCIKRIISILKILFFDYGLLRSVIRESAVDFNGTPLPWYTYPTIEYLKSFDLSDKIVFEWGCGNSSHFWATRCKEVFSCESDERWYDRVVVRKAKNQEIFLCKDEGSYVKQIEKLDSRFDIVVIDGKFRKSCAEKAIDYLNDGGIIILDNSDWYPETSGFLRSKCFFQIDFTGFGPINGYTWTTAFFIKFDLAMDRLPSYLFHHPIGGLRKTCG